MINTIRSGKALLVSLVALGVACGVKATDYTWLPTAGNTAETAYEWDDPDNWQGGTVPKGADVSCSMKGAAFSGSATMYIRLPEAGLTLADLKCVETKADIHFVGGPLTLANAGGTSYLTGAGTTGHYYHFNVPITVTGNLYVKHQYRVKFYRPVTVSGDIEQHFSFQMNLKETAAASGIQTNAFPTGTYKLAGDNPVLNLLSGDGKRYRQQIAWIKCSSAAQLQTRMSSTVNETDYGDTAAMIEVDVAKLTGSQDLTLSMDGVYDNQCGMVRLRDTSGYTGTLQAQQARLWLYRNADGSDPTLKKLSLQNAANCNTRVRLYVPEADVTATFGTLVFPDPYNASRSAVLVKYGPGRLSFTDYNPTATRTRLVVKEGTLALGSAAGTIEQPYLTLEDGTTLEIPEGVTLNVGEATFRGHITVKGPGTLNVAAYSADTAIEKLTYADNAKYTPGHNATDLARMQTVAEVRGTPALWLDANDLGMGVSDVHGETSAAGYIARWTDTRAKTGDEGYMSVTNANTPVEDYRPTLVAGNVPVGGNCVSMNRNYSAQGYHAMRALFWDRPLTNITHVFMVADPKLGSGQILGATTRLVDLGLVKNDWTKEPFYRGHWDWNDNGNFIHSDNVWTSCKNGTWRNNGLKVDPTAASAWGGQTGGKMIEFHPAGTVPADAFGAGVNPTGGNGQSVLHEVLIYTNVLSDVDRRCVAAYLMKKWLERAYDPSDDAMLFPKTMEGSGELSVAAGETLGLEHWASDGTIVKNGAGAFEIALVQAPAGGIEVKDGTLRVVSNAITGEDELPADPALHLDATKNRFDVKSVVNGTNFIGRWKDVRDNAPYEVRKRSSADTLPWVRENALNGLPMLDFGPLGPETYGNTGPSRRTLFQMMKAPTTTYGNDVGQEALPNAAVTFQIFGSEYGGNTIFDGPTIAGNAIAPRETTNSTAAVVNVRWCTMAKKGVFSLNGREYIDPTAARLSGAFDLIAWRQNGTETSGVDIAALAFSAHAAKASGGQLLGEVLVYTNQIDAVDYKRVQSYLHNKWFGDYLEGYRPSEMARLSVAPAATFELEGGKTTVSTIGGGGTVAEGDLRLAAGGVIELFVNADGTVAPLTIGPKASLAVLGGGTVRLTGDVAGLKAVSMPVICGNVTFAENAVWTIENASTTYVCTLKWQNGCPVFMSFRRGSVLIFR